MVYFKKITTYIGIANVLLLILLLAYFLYVNIVEGNNKRYIKSNLESLDYSEGMRKSIYNINKMYESYFFNPSQNFDHTAYDNDIKSVNLYIEAEENGLFEKGEKELSEHLKTTYKAYVSCFDSALLHNDHSTKLYFSKLIPRQKELVTDVNQIFVTNYYALIARSKDSNAMVNNGIVVILIFFEMILFVVLYLFSRSAYKIDDKPKKTNYTRDKADYPKFLVPLLRISFPQNLHCFIC